MSLETLKREAAALNDEERRELCAFLISLREKQWVEFLRNASKRLDDPDPNRWLTIEEFKRRLDEIPAPPAE